MKIVSDGLDFYIRAIMKKHHLGEIEYFPNVVVFCNNDSLTLNFPQANELCGVAERVKIKF